MNTRKFRLRLSELDGFKLHGAEMRLVEVTRDRLILAEAWPKNMTVNPTALTAHLAQARHVAFSHDEAKDLVAKRELIVLPGFYSKNRAASHDLMTRRMFALLPPQTQADATYRLDFAKRFQAKEAEKLRLMTASGSRIRRRKERSDVKMRPLIKEVWAEMLIRQAEVEKASVEPKPKDNTGEAKRAYKARGGNRRRKPKVLIANSPMPHSPSPVRGWLRIIEQYGPVDGLVLLGDRYRNCGLSFTEFEPEIMAAMHAAALERAKRTRPTWKLAYNYLNDLVDDLNAAHPDRPKPFKSPNIQTFKSYYERSFGAYVDALGREGEDAAANNFSPVLGGLTATRPLEIVEADDWEVDLMVLMAEAGVWEHLPQRYRAKIERTRWQLCVALDFVTRTILGMRLAQTSSVANAKATFHMAFIDKTPIAKAVGAACSWEFYGRPECWHFDNGGNFVAAETLAALTAAGCDYLIMPTGKPRLRGRIERLFRTMQLGFVRNFEGQTFSNVVEKAEYDAQGRAGLTVQELADLFVRWVVDIYHNSPHDGLQGETPANCWHRLEAEYGVTPPPNTDELRDIFGVTLRRKVTKAGFRLLGLQFNAAELLEMFKFKGKKAEAQVRLGHADIRRIGVEINGRWCTIEHQDAALTDVSIDAWMRALAITEAQHTEDNRRNRKIVTDAARAIRAAADKAARRANISTAPLSVEDIQAAEAGSR